MFKILVSQHFQTLIAQRGKVAECDHPLLLRNQGLNLKLLRGQFCQQV
jgi:hypothetical protein